MKKYLIIAAITISIASVPLIYFFVSSFNYELPGTGFEEEYDLRISAASPVSAEEAAEFYFSDTYNTGANDVSQEIAESDDIDYNQKIYELQNLTAYEGEYNREIMFTRPIDFVASVTPVYVEEPSDEDSTGTGAGAEVTGETQETADNQNQDQEQVQEQESSLSAQIVPETGQGAVNPLTGEAFNASRNAWDGNLNSRRPWAVSIGNMADAMPLWGIGKADIICEFVVESVATRIIALFQDVSDVGRIGGIRSLRSSSMEIAESFDAIFTHWGGRTYKNEVASGSPVTDYGTIDAAALGSRDSSKIAPNNAIVNSGSELINGLPESFRKEHFDGYNNSFKFVDIGMPENGEHADTVTVSFSDLTVKKTVFSYDIYKGKYYVSQFGRELVDGNDNEKLSFTNIIIMQTKHKFDINEPGHTDVTTTGIGTGYFINGRKYTEITWSRDGLSSPYSYFLPDGTPLELGVGKTYICFVDNGQTPVFS